MLDLYPLPILSSTRNMLGIGLGRITSSFFYASTFFVNGFSSLEYSNKIGEQQDDIRKNDIGLRLDPIICTIVPHPAYEDPLGSYCHLDQTDDDFSVRCSCG